MMNTATAAQRSHSAPPADKSIRTIYTGISTTRTRVILLAVVIVFFLQHTDKLTVIGVHHTDVGKVTGLDMFFRREPDLPVDIRRVGKGPAVIALFIGIVALAQDLHGLADARFVVIVHDAGLDLGDHVRALPGDLGIRIFHLCRARALLRGERKRTDALELVFLQKVTELGKFRLALAGKAGDKARAEHKAWDLAAELGKQLLDVFAVAAAVHAAEDIVVDVLDRDIKILDDLIAQMQKDGKTELDGESCFKLSDTYGFPIDLTREILQEKNIGIDEERFFELMNEQKAKARSNQAFKGGWDEATANALSGLTTTFVGYKSLTADSKILAMIKDGEVTDVCNEGDEVTVVLDITPFYAESGGQVGDCGTITAGENVMQVIDTKKTGAGQFICNCHVESGCFYTDDSVKSAVDEKKRMATARNHTCAHLLQAALRKVLGDHVHQAGSFVDPYRCRFDFSHFSAVTPEELEKIEMLVNDWILAGIPVVTEELPIEEARKKGAMALFGEKYGDIVRVVQAGDVSTEFCGGTHLDNTAKAGLFKIISETSVASGVRRIEAVTGYNVLSAYDQTKAMVTNIAQVLKIANPSAVMQKCENMMNEMHAMQAEIDRLNGIISMSQMKNITEGATEVNGIKVFSAMLSGVTGDSLRKAGDKLKDANDSFVAVLAGVSDGKGNFLCIASPEAVAKGANAGKIVKEIAAIAGGKGGGKPDTAMAGIADVTKIDEALLALTDIVKNMIG